MDKKDYLKDISDIKNMMDKSSKFNLLSGKSGIISGTYVLVGSLIAYQYVTKNNIDLSELSTYSLIFLLADLAIIIVLSLLTSIIITKRKAKKENASSWSIVTKKMAYNFFIILIPSSIFVFILILKSDFNYAGSLMLFFYGTSLINASHNTFKEIRTLGLIEILLGICAVIYPSFTFWFWILGAGVVHITFGFYMYLKHEKK
jgi:hypothetical protein